MSETVNFCTNTLSFCGFGCDTVEFVDLEKRCCTPRFWWFAEKLLLLADLANLTFDLFFVRKLQDEGEEVWALLLFCATVFTFIGTMIIGKALLFHVKNFDTSNKVLAVYKEQVYYGFWSLTEVAAFLLEDATTLYVYYSIDGIFDATNPLDVANVYMSVASGGLSLLALLCMTCTIYSGTPRKCVSNFILFAISGLLIVYPSYLIIISVTHDDLDSDMGKNNLIELDSGIESIFNDDKEDNKGGNPQNDELITYFALGVSSFFGYFFFFYLAFSLCCHKCCADTGIEWPTSNGMYLQGDLEDKIYNGVGSPNNIVVP